MTLGRVYWAIFAILTAAVLAATPVASGFAGRSFTCDFGASPDWATTLLNFRHLAFYGIFAASAFLAFRDRPVWVPVLVVLLVTVAVEVEQSLLVDGHCRLRDMLPNIVAVGIGWLLAMGASRLIAKWTLRPME